MLNVTDTYVNTCTQFITALSLSVSLSLFLSLSLSLSLSLHLSLITCLSLSLSVCLSVSLITSVCVSVSVSPLSLSLSLPLSASPSPPYVFDNCFHSHHQWRQHFRLSCCFVCRWERLHRRDQRRSPLPPGGEEGAVGGAGPGEHGALSLVPPSHKVTVQLLLLSIAFI